VEVLVSKLRLAGAVVVLAVVGIVASNVRAQQDTFDDATTMVEFQRRVDAYAFQHRQVQRRLGAAIDPDAMAAGMRAARPSAAAEDFFTPIVAAAFRHRIATALRTPSCKIAGLATSGSEVPRVGVLAISTQAIPACLVKALPRVPEELEYRVASVALILLDTHANTVVDVLHGAF
jgi:hypothetical protein